MVAKDDYILLEINLNPSLLKYCDEKEKNEMKCIRFYEKIFDYKEELIRKKSIK